MIKDFILPILLLAGFASAGNTIGFCSFPTLQEDFEPSRYMGLWNEQRRDTDTPG